MNHSNLRFPLRSRTPRVKSPIRLKSPKRGKHVSGTAKYLAFGLTPPSNTSSLIKGTPEYQQELWNESMEIANAVIRMNYKGSITRYMRGTFKIIHQFEQYLPPEQKDEFEVWEYLVEKCLKILPKLPKYKHGSKKWIERLAGLLYMSGDIDLLLQAGT
jgi:hypothetical protein